MDHAIALPGWRSGRAAPRAKPDVGVVPGYRWRRSDRPELRKALSYVQGRVAEARSLLDIDVPAAQAPLRTSEACERVRELIDRGAAAHSIDSAWELANQLKREVLLIGDTSYVWAQLDYELERDKKPSRWHRWSDHFPRTKLQKLIAARRKGVVDPVLHADAVRSLWKLYELRAEAGLERRVRAEQKCYYLTGLMPLLLLLLVMLALALTRVGGHDVWRQVVVAASAGALGATLSGIFRVRDRLVELDDLRSFWPAMRIQPLIGATAGLITLLVLETGAVNLGAVDSRTWAPRALFSFAAGFSEPFFLGLVHRVAVVPDKGAIQKA
jgi:hypothetical protein